MLEFVKILLWIGKHPLVGNVLAATSTIVVVGWRGWHVFLGAAGGRGSLATGTGMAAAVALPPTPTNTVRCGGGGDVFRLFRGGFGEATAAAIGRFQQRQQRGGGRIVGFDVRFFLLSFQCHHDTKYSEQRNNEEILKEGTVPKKAAAG